MTSPFPSRTVGGLPSVWVRSSESSASAPAGDPVDSQLGELDTIAVDTPHWRTGIGRALMSLALQYLVSDGYNEAMVWTVEGYDQGPLSTKPSGGGETAGSETRDDRYASGKIWPAPRDTVAVQAKKSQARVTIRGVCGP